MKKSAKKNKNKNSNTNYIIAGLVIIFLFILMVIFWINRGTFGLVENAPSVSLSCPAEATPGANIVCDVTLNIENNEPIYSVNANYDLASELEFVGFEIDSECQESCFEEYANTNSGFALVNINGATSSVTIGQLTIAIPSNTPSGDNYKIGLKNIELTNQAYEMTELDNYSTSISVSGEEPGPVTEGEMVTRIKDHTTYGELKTALNLANDVVIISNKGGTITDSDIVKTGDKIQLSNGTEVTLSVLGDLTGDGLVRVNDVGKLYRHLKQREIITAEHILAAGNVINDETIKTNDVGRMYRYVKERITSLEVIK